MVLGICAIVDNLLDGLGDVFLHLQGLAQGGQRIVPLVFAVDGFLHMRANCNQRLHKCHFFICLTKEDGKMSKSLCPRIRR